MTTPRARIILEIEVGIPAADLTEVVVRLPPRSSRWIAIYTGPDGGQVSRSTGLRDRDQAMAMARRWERAARLEHEAKRVAGGQGIRQRRGEFLRTQDEVARIMGLTTRGIRGIERRALVKLRRLLSDIIDEELTSPAPMRPSCETVHALHASPFAA